MSWLLFLKNKYVVRALVGLAVVVLVISALVMIRNEAYNRGYATSENAWVEKMMLAEADRRRVEAELHAVQASREREAQDRTTTRTVIVHTAREEIANAADTEARYSAYLALHERLRRESAERFARVRADYLSAVDAAV